MRQAIGLGRVGGHPAVVRGRVLLERLLPRGAVLLTVLTLSSYVVGLLRDRTLARSYGAGVELDAFLAAFQLPELALDVLVASGLAAPFVPLFIALRSEGDELAVRFAQTITTLAVIVMAGASAILFLTADATASLVLDPSFPAAGRTLYVELFRVMCVTPVLFAASLALGELLVAERRFLWYGLALPMYNGGIVAGAVVLGPRLGIFGAAVGAILGAALHLGVRVVGVARGGRSLRPALALRMRAVREFIRLMLPKTLSQPIEPLTFQVFTRIASGLGTGNVTALNLARNFQGVPINLIGASFAIAVFPSLSDAAAEGDRARFVSILRANAISIGAITIVAAAAMALVADLAIGLLLGGEAFDRAAVSRTATALEAFALSVPLESLTHLLARAIYATRNTILPVLASLVGFGVAVVAAALLAPGLGLAGLPIGFAAGSAVKVTLLGVALVPRIRSIGRLPPPEPATARSSGRPR